MTRSDIAVALPDCPFCGMCADTLLASDEEVWCPGCNAKTVREYSGTAIQIWSRRVPNRDHLEQVIAKVFALYGAAEDHEVNAKRVPEIATQSIREYWAKWNAERGTGRSAADQPAEPLEELKELPALARAEAAEGASDNTVMDAWGIIANAGGGDWTTQTPEWQAAAARWRDYALSGPSGRAAIRAEAAEGAIKAAVETEREACAQIAERKLFDQEIADAIRARAG